jgi:hypothetical protein
MTGTTEDAKPPVTSAMPIVDLAPIPIKQLAWLHQLGARWQPPETGERSHGR